MLLSGGPDAFGGLVTVTVGVRMVTVVVATSPFAPVAVTVAVPGVVPLGTKKLATKLPLALLAGGTKAAGNVDPLGDVNVIVTA